jgi:hypothetical protein
LTVVAILLGLEQLATRETLLNAIGRESIPKHQDTNRSSLQEERLHKQQRKTNQGLRKLLQSLQLQYSLSCEESMSPNKFKTFVSQVIIPEYCGRTNLLHEMLEELDILTDGDRSAM